MYRLARLAVTLLCLVFFWQSAAVNSQENGEDFVAAEESKVSPQIEEMAYREAVRAAEDPEKFHQGVKDISTLGAFGGMTTEMAKFYWAVAAVEFTHCLTSNDSTACTQYMQQLKDPVGHLGFVLFMKTNKMTLDMAQTLSRGRINPGMASYLGLAAGMMAQSVFQDLYFHPTVQALLKLHKIHDPVAREAKRKELLNTLWKDFTQNTGRYLFNKIPDVMGLLGTAYVSHKTVQMLGHLFKHSDRLIKFAFDKQTARTIIRFGHGLYRNRQLAKAGIKFVFKGSKLVRVNPVVAIASYFAETVLFLVLAPIIEEEVTKVWDRGNAMIKISNGKTALEDLMNAGASPEAVEQVARVVNQGYDQFRKSIMNKAEITKMRHLQAIQDVDMKYQKMLMYYEWLGQGMDYKADLWTLNQEAFHETGLVNEINESNDYAKTFFCGKSPENAVERTFDVHGIPMPFSYSYDFKYDDNRTHYENMRLNEGFFRPTGIELSGFKAFHVDNICEGDLNRMNGGSRPGSYDMVTCPLRSYPDTKQIVWGNNRVHAILCRIFMVQARSIVLRTGMLKGRDVREDLADGLDETGGKVLQKIYSQRDLMVMRFEKAVRVELLKAMTGKEVSIDPDAIRFNGPVQTTSYFTGSYPLGIIANYDFENRVWGKYMTDYTRYQKVLSKVWTENEKKREMALELQRYTTMDYAFRVRSTPFFQEIPRADWQKIVHSYRTYIVP